MAADQQLWKAIIFGIVEGITEWLPISSTGHMILLNEFLTLNVEKSFWDMFLVVIQLGAILAVVVLFWSQIWPFGLSGGRRSSRNQGSIWREDYCFVGPIAVKMPIIIN